MADVKSSIENTYTARDQRRDSAGVDNFRAWKSSQATADDPSHLAAALLSSQNPPPPLPPPSNLHILSALPISLPFASYLRLRSKIIEDTAILWPHYLGDALSRQESSGMAPYTAEAPRASTIVNNQAQQPSRPAPALPRTRVVPALPRNIKSKRTPKKNTPAHEASASTAQAAAQEPEMPTASIGDSGTAAATANGAATPTNSETAAAGIRSPAEQTLISAEDKTEDEANAEGTSNLTSLFHECCTSSEVILLTAFLSPPGSDRTPN